MNAPSCEVCGKEAYGPASLYFNLCQICVYEATKAYVEKNKGRKKAPARKAKRALCHCCHKRERDPYDPEGRCGHEDCIPY